MPRRLSPKGTDLLLEMDTSVPVSTRWLQPLEDLKSCRASCTQGVPSTSPCLPQPLEVQGVLPPVCLKPDYAHHHSGDQ